MLALPIPPVRRAALLPAAAALLLLAACGQEELLHGLDESQANHALVALDEAGVRAEKRREEGTESAWMVSVAADQVSRAHRVLAERELPRPRAPGFGEVFGKGSMVPTPVEERALYLHALAGELSRSVEAIDGVVEARVHLALPPEDPFRGEPRRPARAAVLVKCRPGALARLEGLRPGIQSLVAGAADGLDAAAVSVVLAESEAPALAPAPVPRGRSWPLIGAAAIAALLAIGLAAWGARARWPLLRRA